MGEEPDAIRAEIEETRERMGDTVDALAYKADVKTRAKESVSDKVDTLKSKVTGAGDSVRESVMGARDSVAEATPSGGEIKHRYREGELSLPASWDGVVTAVLGLDDRPQTLAHFILAAAATTSYTPQEVGKRYGFPTDRTGAGRSWPSSSWAAGTAPRTCAPTSPRRGCTGPPSPRCPWTAGAAPPAPTRTQR
jgi:kumamolisin